jgi:hypothetical protein
MACENQVGVKNILLTFFNCNTNERSPPISHKQANDELPTVKACSVVNERLPGGYTMVTHADARVSISVIRDLRYPLAYYQGCVAIDLQLEMMNGLIYTGLNGGVVGDESSNTHEVALDLTFIELDEMLPPGALTSG